MREYFILLSSLSKIRINSSFEPEGWHLIQTAALSQVPPTVGATVVPDDLFMTAGDKQQPDHHHSASSPAIESRNCAREMKKPFDMRGAVT